MCNVLNYLKIIMHAGTLKYIQKKISASQYNKKRYSEYQYVKESLPV